MAEKNDPSPDSKEPIYNSFGNTSNRDNYEIKKRNSKKDSKDDSGNVEGERDSETVKTKFSLELTVHTNSEQHPERRHATRETEARGNDKQNVKEDDSKENNKQTSRNDELPSGNHESNNTADSDGVCPVDKSPNQVLQISKHETSVKDEQTSSAQDVSTAICYPKVEDGPVLTDKQHFSVPNHSPPLPTHGAAPISVLQASQAEGDSQRQVPFTKRPTVDDRPTQTFFTHGVSKGVSLNDDGLNIALGKSVGAIPKRLRPHKKKNKKSGRHSTSTNEASTSGPVSTSEIRATSSTDVDISVVDQNIEGNIEGAEGGVPNDFREELLTSSQAPNTYSLSLASPAPSTGSVSAPSSHTPASPPLPTRSISATFSQSPASHPLPTRSISAPSSQSPASPSLPTRSISATFSQTSTSPGLPGLHLTPPRGPAPPSSRLPSPGPSSGAEALPEQSRTETDTGPRSQLRLRGQMILNRGASPTGRRTYSHVVDIGSSTENWDDDRDLSMRETSLRGPAPSRLPSPGPSSGAEAWPEQSRTETDTGPRSQLRLRGHMILNRGASPTGRRTYSHVVDLGSRTENWDDDRDLSVREQTEEHVEILGVSDLQFRQEEHGQLRQDESRDAADIRRVEEHDLLEQGVNLTMSHLISVYEWGNRPTDNTNSQPMSNESRCLQCHERQVDVIVFNCQHRVLCHVCVNLVDRCPRCHTLIDWVSGLN